MGRFTAITARAAGIALAATALTAPLFAQALTGPPAKPDLKFSTAMPPGVLAPERVETRFGSLRMEGGVPDDEATAKIYDNLDYQRAVQAYLLALPVVNQMANRAAIMTVGPVNGTVPIWEQMVDSRTVELTANDNTPYSWFWLDLRNGPLVLEAPPKVLGLVNDIWYHWNGDIGFTGPDKGQGGKFLIVPPGWKGEIPAGYHVIRTGSLSVWVAWRSFVENGSPAAGVEMVKKTTKIYPLGQSPDAAKMNFVNMSGKPFNMVGPGDYRFWEMLNEAVQNEPTEAIDATTLGFWASIGIEKGKTFAPDDRMKKILTEAAAAGDATARAQFFRNREPEALYFENRNWKHAFIGGYKFEKQPGVANLTGASMFFFAATGVTPAMDTQIVGEGSTYPWTASDVNNKPLDGGKTYKLHLPPHIPVKTFWSVIVYDAQTRSMVQTNQQHPSLSSQNKGLKVNADTSVDVYFGPKPVKGHESNWIQTVPGQSWMTILRLYGPLQPWFDKSWRPDDIVEVK